MILSYKIEDEDLKFLCYCIDKDCEFEISEETSLKINDEVFTNTIEKIFELNKEEFSFKEFNKCRKNPTAKEFALKTIDQINFINLVKNMLEKATLKDYEFLAKKYSNFIDVDFLMVRFISGKIIEIKEVENMDKIYKEVVKTNKNHNICSGLREYFSKEELLNNNYLFIVNIKKVKLGAEFSEGMICCGSNDNFNSNDNTDNDNNNTNDNNTNNYTNDFNKKIIEPIKVTKNGFTVSLEGRLNIFENLNCKEIDLKKSRYKNILSEFKIIDHKLTFKGMRVLHDNESVILKMKEGNVS